MRWNETSRRFGRSVCLFILAALFARQASGQIAPDPNKLKRGLELFNKEWQPDDEASPKGDGLGPLFNAKSCVACHRQGGVGGGGPNERNAQLLTAVAPEKLEGVDKDKFRIRLNNFNPAFGNGSTIVFHRFGTDADYANYHDETLGFNIPFGLSESRRARMIRAIQRRLDKAGPVKPLRYRGIDFLLSDRNTPALFGAAQIDSIDRNALVAVAERQEKKAQGVSGRVPPGKFGWRGQTATFREFILGACAVEVGLQVKGHAQFNDPLDPNRNEGIDMDDLQTDDMITFIAHLPAPVRASGVNPTAIRYGENLFKTVGCAECHVETLGGVKGLYSDLLLHDMGPQLADPSPAAPETVLAGTRSVGSGYFGSTQVDVFADVPSNIKQEWRTPPLWGVASSAPYLHDGRAATLEEAIALHDGEAAASRIGYQRLNPDGKRAVIGLLKALVAPPNVPAVPETPNRKNRADFEPAAAVGR